MGILHSVSSRCPLIVRNENDQHLLPQCSLCLKTSYRQCPHNFCFCFEHLIEHQQQIVEKFKYDVNKFKQLLNDEIYYICKRQQHLHKKIDEWKIRKMNSCQHVEKINVIHDKISQDIDRTYENIINDLENLREDYKKYIEEKLYSIDYCYQIELNDALKYLQKLNGKLEEIKLLRQRIKLMRDHASGIIELVQQKESCVDDIEDIFSSYICVKQYPLRTNLIQSCAIDLTPSLDQVLLADNSQLKFYDKNKHDVIFSIDCHCLTPQGYVRQIEWASYLQKFLILTSQSLFTFDCETLKLIKIKSISKNRGMSYMTNCNSTLLLNLNDGEYIQHWSISHRPFYLLKQWSMNTKNIILDVYLYSPNSLVMNILDVSSNYKCEIDFFDLYTMSRLHCISNDKFPICFEMKLLHQQQWLMKSDHHYFLYNEDRNEMEQIENNIDPNYMKILKLTQHEYVVLKCQDDMTTLEFYRPYF